ncbi:hypothetical protein EG347_10585 [Chryseobacterium sp. G0186]|nr:hypothetical protein EG347_10585 [Chryseobacterium sp. G0186]
MTAQIGINTVSPKTTLDIKAKTYSGNITTPEGFLVPRIDRLRAQSMISIPPSTLIYVNNISTGTLAGNAINIDDTGYYYFDSSKWRKLDTSLYNENGNLSENRIVTQGSKTLAFTGTAKNSFSVDGNTLSVDAADNKVGIGNISPVTTLDIEGTARLSPNIAANTPPKLFNARPLYINNNNGEISYAPKGFTTVSGGYRPGSNVLATFPVKNTLVRVRFVCFVDASSDSNNNINEAYTYGSFTIIGRGTSNPVKMIDVNVKNVDGTPKSLTNNDGTSIEWDNYALNHITISLNQSTGQLRFSNSNTVFSYMFEFLGGT